MSSLSKNSAITFFSQISIFFITLASSIILARILGPKDKGIYALIVLIPSIITQLGTLGIETANVYFAGSRKHKLKNIIANSLVAISLLTPLLLLIFFGISHLDIWRNFSQTNGINQTFLWLAIIGLPFLLIMSLFNNILLGKEKVVKFNQINIFREAWQLATIVLFLWILKQGVLGAVFSFILTNLVSAGLVLISVNQLSKLNFAFKPTLLKASIIYGGKAYLGNLAQFLNYRLDILIVAFFLGPIAVGFYSLAVAMSERLWTLPGAIATVLFPRIASLQDNEANILTPKVTRHSMFITTILAGLLALTAQPLIKILFGAVFLPSLKPLLILLPGTIIFGGVRTLVADLAGRGRPGINAWASLAALSAKLPLSIFLIPKWGISGAAMASTITYTLAALIIIIVFIRITKQPLSNILLIKKQDLKDYRPLVQRIKRRVASLIHK